MCMSHKRVFMLYKRVFETLVAANISVSEHEFAACVCVQYELLQICVNVTKHTFVPHKHMFV